jgi:hypothetical protein
MRILLYSNDHYTTAAGLLEMWCARWFYHTFLSVLGPNSISTKVVFQNSLIGWRRPEICETAYRVSSRLRLSEDEWEDMVAGATNEPRVAYISNNHKKNHFLGFQYNPP